LLHTPNKVAYLKMIFACSFSRPLCFSSSMIAKLVFIGAITTIFQVPPASGHGRLLNPPSRASMWRVGFDTPPDYNDNQGFCGGFAHQFSVNGGKCGICGDPWDANPRAHEVGGKYANGIITKTYQPGQDIDIEVEITANHLGKFTFKLCANNDLNKDPEQECFDSTVLPVLPDLANHYDVGPELGMYRMKLRLPENITCTQCILQWTYTGGNNWGACGDGTGKLGCGPQEHFRACSDITIQEGSLDPLDREQDRKIFQSSGTSTAVRQPVKCKPTVPYQNVAGMEEWCEFNCNYDPAFCPESHCQCYN